MTIFQKYSRTYFETINQDVIQHDIVKIYYFNVSALELFFHKVEIWFLAEIFH